VSEFTASAALYRPMPGHSPRSRQDRYRRCHWYVARLGSVASQQLKQALLVLKNAADELPTPALQQAARKNYSEGEFMAATKEMLCIWIHLEAVDQGGTSMPSWLMNYLQLALYASDFLIEQPKSAEVMQAHAECKEIPALLDEVALTISRYLGFGEVAEQLAPAFVPLPAPVARFTGAAC
jgi:hypothetical protein